MPLNDTVCTRSAYGLHTVCTRSPHGLHTVCTRPAHGLYTVCTRSAYGLHTVCTRSAHGLLLSAHTSLYCPLHSSHKHLALRPINSKLLTPVITFTGQQQPISTPSTYSFTNCTGWCQLTSMVKVKVNQPCDYMGLNQQDNKP